MNNPTENPNTVQSQRPEAKAAGCCGPAKLATCCAPSAKSACCGTTETKSENAEQLAPATCGCQ